MMTFSVKPIGILHTPYDPVSNPPPFQPKENIEDSFVVELYSEHTNRLKKLDLFSYIYVLYWLDKAKNPKIEVTPPMLQHGTVGLFASRSPNRINPIGLSVVNLKKIKENTLLISSIDAYDKTPVIDIKPYVKDLDAKPDANHGWLSSQ